MNVLTLTFNDFRVNTYIVSDPFTNCCAIIDPGMTDTLDAAVVARKLKENNLKAVHLINTHQHIDHVIGNSFINYMLKLKPEGNIKDDFLGKRVIDQAAVFGLTSTPKYVPIDTYLQDGDIIEIGTGRLKVLEVPGHSPGSIALYCEKDGFVFTGDALFSGSIGRTDLPGGDYDTLINSVNNKLFSLPDNTVVLPGHGPATTIHDEKRINPYFRNIR